MIDRLYKVSRKNEIKISKNIFQAMVLTAIDTQHWSKIRDLLEEATPENTEAQFSIMNTVKQNMVYCFDAQVRN
jgi:hypothetical protein